MAWIEIVPDEQWVNDPSLESLYANVVDSKHQRIDRIMAIHSLNPRGLKAHHSLYSSVMSGTSTLRKVERELIALVVSLENQCFY